MEAPISSLGKIFGSSEKTGFGKAPAEDTPSDSTAATTVDKEVAAPVETTASTTTAEPATTVDKDVDSTGKVTEDTASTVTKEIAPEVEHEKKVEEHEQKEQTVIEKERHQDHYKTTIQPVQDKEVLPEKHEHEQTATEVQQINHDDGAVAAKHESQAAGFKDTTEDAGKVETKTVEPTAVASEEVHHHLHETIQPVIEKETVQPTVTHKQINVKEVHQDAAVDEGTEIKPPISKDELESKLASE